MSCIRQKLQRFLGILPRNHIKTDMGVTEETMACILGCLSSEHCGRGTIGVTKREPLMEIACECYSISKKRVMDR